MEQFDRSLFNAKAVPVGVAVQDGPVIHVGTKVFKKGSLGWYYHGRIKIQGFDVQVSLCMTCVGSAPGWVPLAKRTEQNGTMPEKAPETPQGLFEAENDSEPKKPRRKRS